MSFHDFFFSFLYYGLALFWRCGVRAMVDTRFLDCYSCLNEMDCVLYIHHV